MHGAAGFSLPLLFAVGMVPWLYIALSGGFY